MELKDLPLSALLQWLRRKLQISREMVLPGSIPLTGLDTTTGTIPYSALTVADGEIPPLKIGTGHYAIARRTTNQTINNNTITAVSFDSQVADTASMFTPTSSVINLLVPGLYLVVGNVYWATAGTANTRMFTGIRTGGSVFHAVDEDTASTTEQKGQSVAALVPVATTDTVELIVFQTNAATTTRTISVTGTVLPRLAAYRLGA